MKGPPGAKRLADGRELKELSFAEKEKWDLVQNQNQRDGKDREEKISATPSGEDGERAKANSSEGIIRRALPTPPASKKCNWGILGFGAGKSTSGSKKSGTSNSNWAAPNSPGFTNKEITSEAKIAADKQPLTTRPPTPTTITPTLTTTRPTTTKPPKLPEKVKKPTANLSGVATDTVDLGSRQTMKKTGETGKGGIQASEEKQTTSEQSSSSVATQPTPPPRKRRLSGQR